MKTNELQIVGYGLFVEGECLSIGKHPSSGHVGSKAYRSEPLVKETAALELLSTLRRENEQLRAMLKRARKQALYDAADDFESGASASDIRANAELAVFEYKRRTK